MHNCFGLSLHKRRGSGRYYGKTDYKSLLWPRFDIFPRDPVPDENNLSTQIIVVLHVGKDEQMDIGKIFNKVRYIPCRMMLDVSWYDFQSS